MMGGKKVLQWCEQVVSSLVYKCQFEIFPVMSRNLFFLPLFLQIPCNSRYILYKLKQYDFTRGREMEGILIITGIILIERRQLGFQYVYQIRKTRVMFCIYGILCHVICRDIFYVNWHIYLTEMATQDTLTYL